jgi:hypothetical protein
MSCEEWKHVSAVKGEVNLKEKQTLSTKYRKIWIKKNKTIYEFG